MAEKRVIHGSKADIVLRSLGAFLFLDVIPKQSSVKQISTYKKMESEQKANELLRCISQSEINQWLRNSSDALMFAKQLDEALKRANTKATTRSIDRANGSSTCRWDAVR